MSAVLRIPTVLRPAMGGASTLNVEGQTIGDVLSELSDAYPAVKGQLLNDDGSLHRFLNVYINDDDVRYLGGVNAPVANDDEITLLPVGEVDVFQSSDKYTLASNVRGEWLLRTALKDLEPQLDPKDFWRIHRNAIVRVAAIARVSRDLRGQFLIQLHGNARKLAVSRPYAHLFRAL